MIVERQGVQTRPVRRNLACTSPFHNLIIFNVVWCSSLCAIRTQLVKRILSLTRQKYNHGRAQGQFYGNFLGQWTNESCALPAERIIKVVLKKVKRQLFSNLKNLNFEGFFQTSSYEFQILDSITYKLTRCIRFQANGRIQNRAVWMLNRSNH